MNKYVIVTLAIIFILLTLLVFWFASSKHTSKPQGGGFLCKSCGSCGPKFCLIKVHHERAGFFAIMNHVLIGAHMCKQYGMIPVIILDSGPYLETNETFKQQYKLTTNNWYEYYFEQPFVKNEHIIRRLTNQPQYPFSIVMIHKMPAESDKVYLFDDQSLHYVINGMALTLQQYNEAWKHVVKIKPDLVEECLEYESKLPAHSRRIGIHYRGTDKYNGPSGGWEHDAIHYEYEFVSKIVQKESLQDTVLVVCSDEQPFIDHMKQSMPSIFQLSTNSLRATVSTSGKVFDTKKCDDVPYGSKEESPECKEYHDLAGQSIHLGMKNESSYKKGKDVLLDILLLSGIYSRWPAAPNVFYRSRGNASDFPKRINPSLVEIDMNAQY